MAVFVGRDDELRVLGSVAATPLAGDVAAAVVAGDPGSGKSRLLGEARYGVRVPHEFEILGYEPESGVALAAASGMLRSLAAAPGGRELEELLFSAGRLAESPLEPLRVFEATHRALDRLGPTVVFVDDLQWVDAVSLALCHFLLRAAVASGVGLAILAAGHPSEEVTSFTTSLEHAFGDRARLLELGPLSLDDALALARSLAPRPRPGRCARARREGSRVAILGGGPRSLRRSGVRRSTSGVCPASRGEHRCRRVARPARRRRSPDRSYRRGIVQGWEVARTAQAARRACRAWNLRRGGGRARPRPRPAPTGCAGRDPGRTPSRPPPATGRVARKRRGGRHRPASRSARPPSLGGLAAPRPRARPRALPAADAPGRRGLDLLVQIADEADAGDPTVGELNREIASLARARSADPKVALARRLVRAERGGVRLAWMGAPRCLARGIRAGRRGRGPKASRRSAQRCGSRRAAAIELVVQQATLDLWGDTPKRAGRGLASGAARQAEALGASATTAYAARTSGLFASSTRRPSRRTTSTPWCARLRARRRGARLRP